MACGSKEVDRPFPVSPPGKSRGGRVPPTPLRAAPPTRGLRPLVNPPPAVDPYRLTLGIRPARLKHLAEVTPGKVKQ